MSKTIVIGCRLPAGIVLDLIDKTGKQVQVKLNGQNSAQEGSTIILLSERDYGVTDVDADFWEAWKAKYADFEPLTTKAIFEAKDERDAKAIHKEVKGIKTGLEPAPQEDGTIKKAE